MITELFPKLDGVMARDGKTEYSVLSGLNPVHIDELVAFTNDSTDKAIEDFTRDLARFGSREKVNKWLDKGCSAYTLIHQESNQFSGILWLGEDRMDHDHTSEGLYPEIDLTEYGNTFAIRTYGMTRGQGLGVPFMKAAIPDYLSDPKLTNRNVWLETSIGNGAAVYIYSKFGFEHASIDHLPTPGEEAEDAKRKILMVYKSGL